LEPFPSPYEIATLAIATLNLLVVIVGVGFALFQLRNAKKELHIISRSHVENHEFQRRLEAQKAIGDVAASTVSAELHAVFNYIEKNDPIPPDEIEKKFKENDEYRKKLILLLRHYEGLARGINHSIYDEQVVKSALRRTMIRFRRAFGPYIEKRRTQLLNKLLWIEFTDLVDKWEEEDISIVRRQKTGVDLLETGQAKPALQIRHEAPRNYQE
jgi:hypothetical protein